MRENRTHGSEGGESGSTGLPYPYRGCLVDDVGWWKRGMFGVGGLVACVGRLRMRLLRLSRFGGGDYNLRCRSRSCSSFWGDVRHRRLGLIAQVLKTGLGRDRRNDAFSLQIDGIPGL